MKEIISSILVIGIFWVFVIGIFWVFVSFLGIGAVIGSFAGYSAILFICWMFDVSKAVWES